MTTAPYWSVPLPSLLGELGTSARGLSTDEASRRSAAGGSTRLRRTGWFVESVVSATLVVLVVRTRHPLHRSRPGRPLVIAALAVVSATLILPYLPGAEILGFQHLPPAFYLALGAIIAAYVLSAEMAKRWFYDGDLDAAGVVTLRAVREAPPSDAESDR